MDFGTLKTTLRKEVGNPTVGEVSDAEMGEFVNYAYRDVSGRYKHHDMRKRCTFVTTAGIDKYELPPEASVLLGVRDATTGRSLTKQGNRFVASRRVPEYNTRPRAYVRYRHYIQLVPAPDGPYTVELYFTASAGALAGDTNVPVVPEEWHIGIVKLAKWYLYDRKGDAPKAQQAYNTFKLWLSDMPDTIDEEAAAIDSGVELPELAHHRFGWGTSRFDDGYFDYRD